MIVEERKELIKLDKNLNVVHCISRDHAMGKGFAVVVKRYAASQGLHLVKMPDMANCSAFVGPEHKIFNLITKENYWDKPDFIGFMGVLWEWCDWVEGKFPGLVWDCPKLGCGLDRLEWEEVREAMSVCPSKFRVWGVF